MYVSIGVSRAVRLWLSNIPDLGNLRNGECKVQFPGRSGILPRLASIMDFFAFIENADIIQIILKHLSLYEIRNHDPPKETAIETTELIYDGQYAQVPFDDHWVQ